MIKHIKKYKAICKALSVGLLNQIITSATNFAVVVYLVRSMSKIEFGIYSISFAIVMLVSGMVNSLLTVQFVVNYPSQRNEKKKIYCIDYINSVILICCGIIFITLVLKLIPNDYFLGYEELKNVGFFVACAAGAYSLRDFLVRITYSDKCERFTLYSSIIVAISISFTYLVLYTLEVSVSASIGLLVLALGYLSGVLVLAGLLKLSFSLSTWEGLKRAFSDSWGGGKWNVTTNFIYHIRTQIHNLIIPLFISVSALAEANAARVLATPAIMAIPPLLQIIMPRVAEKNAQGERIETHSVLSLTFVVAGIALFYSLIVIPFLPWLLPFVLGDDYEGAGQLVIIWCVVAIVMAARNSLNMILQILKQFRALMYANVMSACIAIISAFSLPYFYGAYGAIIALGVGELSLCILVFLLFTKYQKKL